MITSQGQIVQNLIVPLLEHVASLQQLLISQEFAPEFARLKRGVALFHSDLVYLGTNVSELEEILQSENREINRIKSKEIGTPIPKRNSRERR
jgi:hypothetical protein